MANNKPHDSVIVIPMAGSGRRFREAGFNLPKPLIEVHGRPMITHVIENVMVDNAKLVLIAQRTDAKEHKQAFEDIAARYGAEFVLIDGLTEGAACTVLLAAAHIDNDLPLLLANSDQWVDFSIRDFIQDARQRKLDGSVLTFPEKDRDPKWSYAKLGADDLVTETREKVAISTHATVGIYWFARGNLFVEAADAMMRWNDRTNNEFYVCPAYNYLVQRHLRIGIYEIDRAQMHGWGTPQDLQAYLARNPSA